MFDNYDNCKKKIAEEYYQQMTVTLVPLPVQREYLASCKKEKGNNPMEDKVNYLCRRIDDIAEGFYETFQKQFGVTHPKTFAELVTAITAGKFTAPVQQDKYNIIGGVKWGDQAGFEAAVAAMRTQRQIATDAVVTQDPATAGLAAMQAFQAWTYTAPTSTPSSAS